MPQPFKTLLILVIVLALVMGFVLEVRSRFHFHFQGTAQNAVQVTGACTFTDDVVTTVRCTGPGTVRILSGEYQGGTDR